jgi:N-acyl amino acid synthase of PEP-CTERM/exosortase system
MSLSDNFHRHLEAEIAVSDRQLIEAHRLRYVVYCEDRGYEDPAEFPEGLEKDEFDNNSVHALVRHRSSSQVAGVVRLIFSDRSNPESSLPIELHCGDTFDRAVLDQFEFSRPHIAEVSRFAVSSQFVSGAGIKKAPEDDSSQYFPHISLGLIAMLFVASAHSQITHWYAVMEPSLSRLLSRSGIEFTPIGPIFDYNGKRQPMIAKVNDLLSNIYQKRYDFFKLIEGLGGLPAAFFEDNLSRELAKNDFRLSKLG